MSSGEQTALTIVGGAIGFFAGGPTGALYGAQIGYGLGASTLSTTLPGTHGPRIDDVKTQVATYGWDLPTAWGTVAHAGALMWSTDLITQENVTRQESGGKGAPSTSQSHTTYSYKISCAVAFGSREIDAVRRIWANEHLIYDNSAVDDYDNITTEKTAEWAVTKAGVLEDGEAIHIYLGTETQEPDPVIQSYEGVANTPAFRGTPYFVCEDLQLERFGNRPPQFRVEYVKSSNDFYTNVKELIEVDLNALGISDTLWYDTETSTIEKDLTAHCFVPYYGGGGGANAIAYYKVYPTGNALFAGHYTTQVQGGYRDIRIGCNSEVPMLVTVSSALAEKATLRFPGGGMLGGDFVTQDFLIQGYGTNGSVESITQGGSALEGWMGIWDGADQYTTFNYYQSVGTYLISAYPAFGRSSVYRFTLDVDSGFSLKGVSRSLNYVYSYDMAQKLRRYDLQGNLLNTWDFSGGELTINNANEDGVQVSREDEDIIYIRDEAVALYKIDVSDASNPVITEFTGAIGSNNFYSDTFAVWGGIVGIKSQKGVTYYSLDDVSRDTADLADIVADLLDESGLDTSDYDVTGLSGTAVNGFIKTRVSSAVANINSLMQAYQFSAHEDNHKLVFLPRGGAVDFTILEEDLGAGINNGSNDLLPYERKDDQELPLIVNVSYMDANLDYDRSSQSSQRTAIYGASQVMDVELPLVLTGTEARRIAEIIHTSLWRSRESYKNIRLPLKYLSMVPTNVLQITSDSTTHRLRVTNMNIGEFVEIEGHAEGSIDYTSTITGENISGEYNGSGVPGPTIAYYLNLPPMRSQDTGEGFYILGYGPYTGWKGANIWARTSGAWSPISFVSTNRKGQFGVVESPAGDGEVNVMDNVNSITVRLNTGVLTTVTKTQLLADSTVNALAIIKLYDDNENYSYANMILEIVRFQNATDNGDGTYTISKLLRGQRGTEFATGLMEQGNTVIVLDEDTLVRADGVDAGVRAEMKAVSVNQDFWSSRSTRWSNLNQAAKPFAPAHIKAKDNSDGTFTLDWVRRPRVGGGLGATDSDYQVEETISWQITRRDNNSTETTTTTDTIPATITAYNGDVIKIAQYGSLYGYGYTNNYHPYDESQGFVLEGNILNELADDLMIYFTLDDGDIIDETADGGDKYYLNRAQKNSPGEPNTRYGIIGGHEPASTTGQINQAADFSANPLGVDAAVAYLEFAVAPVLQTGAISFWFKPDGAKFQSMIMGNLNYHLRFRESGGVCVGVRLSLNGNTATLDFTVPTSGWHHIAINKYADTFELWLDGVNQGISDTTSTVSMSIEYIGVHQTGIHGYHSTWAYDQFRVWNNGKVLTQNDVNKLYAET